jgi:hypothetical protein
MKNKTPSIRFRRIEGVLTFLLKCLLQANPLGMRACGGVYAQVVDAFGVCTQAQLLAVRAAVVLHSLRPDLLT